MSLLRSMSFGTSGHIGVSELDDKVLSLFYDLLEHPERKFEYGSEVVEAALDNRIDLDRPFHAFAYAAAVDRNSRRNEYSKKVAHRESNIDFLVSREDEDGHELTEDKLTMSVANKVEDAYDKLADEDELRYAIRSIKALRHVLLIDAKLDIVLAIRQALSGVQESVALLKKFCENEEYKVVAEQIRVILASGYSFEELFSEA